jgi:hypothetical protein
LRKLRDENARLEAEAKVQRKRLAERQGALNAIARFKLSEYLDGCTSEARDATRSTTPSA